LGIILSSLRRPEEATEVTREAVGRYRELAAASPDTYLPDLAKSLNNLGACLASLGRREEAMAAMQEAVQIWRKSSSDGSSLEFAKSLGALGSVHARAQEHQFAADSFV